MRTAPDSEARGLSRPKTPAVKQIPRWSDASSLAAGGSAIALVTIAFRQWLHLTSPTITALVYLLIVLLTATVSRVRAAVAVSIVADLCLNYFFMPPFETLAIADPENWVALFVFLAVGVVASSMSSAVRAHALARQSEELKSTLLASISHDLRTPLTAIRVAASNLQATWLSDDDRREQSELILAEVERLRRLFQNILEMARIDAGAVLAQARWVDPAEIVAAARDQVELALRGHRLDLTIGPDRMVRIDPLLTASALAHVLENAAQYSPANAPIAVSAEISIDGLTISVRDHGRGIAAGDLPHVFDRFYRGAEASRRAAGTGMGLAIAQGMLTAARGQIVAENCDDGGARFTITVPGDIKIASPVERTA
jgi:two-component system sensor histidine kinase KdpD